jgi:hypothetical protein
MFEPSKCTYAVDDLHAAIGFQSQEGREGLRVDGRAVDRGRDKGTAEAKSALQDIAWKPETQGGIVRIHMSIYYIYVYIYVYITDERQRALQYIACGERHRRSENHKFKN